MTEYKRTVSCDICNRNETVVMTEDEVRISIEDRVPPTPPAWAQRSCASGSWHDVLLCSLECKEIFKQREVEALSKHIAERVDRSFVFTPTVLR